MCAPAASRTRSPCPCHRWFSTVPQSYRHSSVTAPSPPCREPSTVEVIPQNLNGQTFLQMCNNYVCSGPVWSLLHV